MNINIEFDSQASKAPVGFRTAVLAAASALDSVVSNNVTLNISVGYGEIQGTSYSDQQSASAGPSTGVYDSYNQVRAYLAANDPASVAALPATTSIQGQASLVVWSAQEKLFGQKSATAGTVDGYVGIGSGVPQADITSVALHEITHAMGRVPGDSGAADIFDLYRFTAPGTRLLGNSSLPAPASYFSLNNGVTDLADYGVSSDPSDFLNNSRTPTDPFDEYYDARTSGQLTSLDLQQLDALGYRVGAGTPTPTTAPTIAINAPTSGGSISILDPTLSGTVVSDPGSTVTLANAGTVLGTAAVDANGNWSLPLSLPSDGSYTITATDTDVAGNVGTASTTFTLDSTPNRSMFGTTVHDITSHGGEVYALYRAILNRAPDAMGLESSVAALDAGMPLTGLAQGLIGSAEYANGLGPSSQLSNEAFVNQLYEDALGRAADPVGLHNAENALAAGTSRQQIAVGVALSQEAGTVLAPVFQAGVFAPSANASAIARLYDVILGRAPDAGGLVSCENATAQGVPLATIATSLLNSPEGSAKFGATDNAAFVSALYESALGRAPDAAGGQGCINALNVGTSRATLAFGLAESPEAAMHLAAGIEAGFHLV